MNNSIIANNETSNMSKKRIMKTNNNYEPSNSPEVPNYP